jgi:hypothetical protein
MSEPVVFISHFRIREGKLEAVRRTSEDVTARLEAEKPRTAVFLSFLDEDSTEVSFVHAFADRAAMDLHFEGAEERARAAFESIEPRGWEVYGTPSDAALQSLRDAAGRAGVPLTVRPLFLGGFMRGTGVPRPPWSSSAATGSVDTPDVPS